MSLHDLRKLSHFLQDLHAHGRLPFFFFFGVPLLGWLTLILIRLASYRQGFLRCVCMVCVCYGYDFPGLCFATFAFDMSAEASAVPMAIVP